MGKLLSGALRFSQQVVHFEFLVRLKLRLADPFCIEIVWPPPPRLKTSVLTHTKYSLARLIGESALRVRQGGKESCPKKGRS